MKLIIDIYVFQLRKVTSSKRTKGGALRYATKKEASQFQDFYDSLLFSGKARNIKSFIDVFVNSFDAKFRLNSDKNKGVCLPESSDLGFKSNENVVYGSFIGGLTGSKYTLYQYNDAKTKRGYIDKSKVAARPFYFKVWMPLDSNYGVLILQSYSNLTFNTMFLKQFESCLANVGYKPIFGKFFVEEQRNKFFRNSNLNRIRISYVKREQDNLGNVALKSLANSKRCFIFNGINMRLADFIKSKNYLLDITQAISELDKNYEPGKDNVFLYCCTDEGQRASTTLSAIENLFPQIILDEDYYDNTNDEPNWELLNAYTDKLLSDVQREYQYFPKPINL